MRDTRACENAGRLSGNQSFLGFFKRMILFVLCRALLMMPCRGQTRGSKTRYEMVHQNHVHIPVVGLCSGRRTVNSLIYHCREHTLLLIFQRIRGSLWPEEGWSNMRCQRFSWSGLVSLMVYTGVAESLLVCAWSTPRAFCPGLCVLIVSQEWKSGGKHSSFHAVISQMSNVQHCLYSSQTAASVSANPLHSAFLCIIVVLMIILNEY